MSEESNQGTTTENVPVEQPETVSPEGEAVPA